MSDQWSVAAKAFCSRDEHLHPLRHCRHLTSLGWDKGPRAGHEDCEPALDGNGLRRFLTPWDVSAWSKIRNYLMQARWSKKEQSHE